MSVGTNDSVIFLRNLLTQKICTPIRYRLFLAICDGTVLYDLKNTHALSSNLKRYYLKRYYVAIFHRNRGNKNW